MRFSSRRWAHAYERTVRSSFATVSFYRERWALRGRQPIPIGDLERRLDDLTPLSSRDSPRRLRRLDRTTDQAAVVHCARGPLPSEPQQGALLNDPLLGPLAIVESCGRWHLDWRHVHAASHPTASGPVVAFTLLRQQSPRLVDAIPAPELRAEITRCPAHASPVLTPGAPA